MKNKTNAMRRLDAAKIAYEVMEYEVDENDLSGKHIADEIGLPHEIVFKTLVAKGDKTGFVVFCIPVDEEIDLKLAAKQTGNKRIEMLAVKELLPTTGYIRGGCSPVGMKKKFPTYFDESAARLDELTVSAGVRGAQLLLNAKEIIAFTQGALVAVTIIPSVRER